MRPKCAFIYEQDVKITAGVMTFSEQGGHMLNELYHLSVALEKAGITPRDWHKDLMLLPNATPKKPCYKILLGSNGISGIEPMKEGLAASLRKWEPSLGNSFPGFNIQPLYRIARPTGRNA